MQNSYVCLMRMQKAKRQQENRVAIVKYDNEQRKKTYFSFLKQNYYNERVRADEQKELNSIR